VYEQVPPRRHRAFELRRRRHAGHEPPRRRRQPQAPLRRDVQLSNLSRLRRRELRRRDLPLPPQLLGLPRLREAVGRAGGGGGGRGAGEVEGEGEGEQRGRGPYLPAQRHLIRLGGTGGKRNTLLPSRPSNDRRRRPRPIGPRSGAAMRWAIRLRLEGEGVAALLPLFFSAARACVQSPQRRGKAREAGGGF